MHDVRGLHMKRRGSVHLLVIDRNVGVGWNAHFLFITSGRECFMTAL